MAMKTLTSARTAIEGTKGSALTVTRNLYAADMSWNQSVATIMPQELRNSYFQNFRAYPGLENAEFTFAGDVTYDDMAFWLSVAVKGVPVVTGGGADKTWTAVPAGATDDLKAFTLEAGWVDFIGTYGNRWAGVQCDEYAIKFEKDKALTYTAKCTTFKGAVAITAYSASPADRTNVTALGTTAKVYIDTSTIGSTQDTSVVSAEFTLKNQLVELNTLDATGTGQALYRPKPRDVGLKITRYLTSITELTAYIAKTERKIRLTTTGPTLGGSNYGLTLDFYGIPTDHKWADVNGLIVEELTFDSIYDSTATTDFSIVAVNSLATIS